MKRNSYLYAALAFYALAVFTGIVKHEMWRDELEPWLVASCSDTLSDFFHNMKMGSNPYIWYLILHFLSKITLDPFILQLAHISFAIGAVFLFLRFSPFSTLQKILFCLGYYMLYEYAIISRGYALTVFFLFLFCTLYKKHRQKPIPLGIVIFFLANAAGGFGAILSIALLFFLIANYYFDETPGRKKTQKIIYMACTVLIILFSIWVAIKSISPPPDSVYATSWYTRFDTARLMSVLSRTGAGFLPVPSLSGIHFWNTSIFLQGHSAGIMSSFLVLLSLLLLAFNTLIFSRKPAVLILYLSGTAGILLFSYTNSSIYTINAARYNGFLYMLFIVCCWLLGNDPEEKKIPYLNAYLIFLLSVNVLAGAIAWYKDFRYTFSEVKETGNYILKNGLLRYSAAGFSDYAVSPISAYTRKPFYYPDRDTSSTFPIWKTKNYVTDLNLVMDRLVKRISVTKDTFLVVLNFNLNASLVGTVQFSLLADFKKAIVDDENFYVFKCFNRSALQEEQAWLRSAQIYFQEQKGDSAIYALEKTIALDSANADAYNNLGICYMNFKKDRNKAEQCWKKSAELKKIADSPGYSN